MKAAILVTSAAAALLAAACSESRVDVTVANDCGVAIGSRMVEVDAEGMPARLASEYFYVTDESGNEVPSQLTHDSLIIFMAEVEPGASRRFSIRPSATKHEYSNVVWGKIYPERRDDIAYENSLGGYRIYGPATQQAGEKAFGYDIFLKYPSDSIILPELYAPETDPAVWAKVDSLRAVSKEAADEYVNTFSYHIDHGKGFDPFAVGPTLGAGAAGIFRGDSIVYPWCYSTAEILDNGPLRFTVEMAFDTGEHRLISLDSGSYLNDCTVWYSGITEPATVVAGFPLRDSVEPLASGSAIAYSSPVAGDDSGRVLLGIYSPAGFDSTFVAEKHILGAIGMRPGEAVNYKWGFSWEKTGIADAAMWLDYLDKQKYSYTVTLQ